MKVFVKRSLSLLLVLLLALSAPFCSMAEGEAPETEQPAEDLTSFLRFDVRGHNTISNRVKDQLLYESEEFFPYERFFAYWDASAVSPGYLCVQWDQLPMDLQLQQLDADGNILSQRVVPYEYDTIEKLLPNTQRVAFISDRLGMDIARIALYSDGVLPEPFLNWNPTPDHLDYLIVSTHPDDDVLFMGGVIPIYGAEQGHVGTVAYVVTPNRNRVNEAKLCVRAMGTDYEPIFLGFSDAQSVEYYIKKFEYCFLPEAVTLALVRVFRQHRPLVVFSHDVNGEYGHWQHIIVSASMAEAARLAADESYDPISVEQYGTWQVQKCYLHLYPGNPLVMDVNTPLDSMGGRTALEVAQNAFLKHRSQQTGRHWVQSDKDAHPMSRFGMAYGVVDPGDGPFDNIDPQLFYSAITVPPVE